jgi:predicted Zn finger-like uncharacterized protein
MKITCQACQSKYTIADDKIQGKVAKIRCRKCGATVLVDASTGAPSNGSAPPPGAAPGVWLVNVAEGDERSMQLQEVIDAYNTGVITGETYLWKEGMADWQPLSDISEIIEALNRGGGAGTAAAPFERSSPRDAQVSGASSGAGASKMSGAARRDPGRAADMFASGAVEEEVATSVPAHVLAQAKPSFGGAPSQVVAERSGGTMGTRDEQSVLFSLNALTGGAKPPAAPANPITGAARGEDSGLIDLNALARAQQSRTAEEASLQLAAPAPFMFPAVLGTVEAPHAQAQSKSSMPLFIGGGIMVAGLAIAVAIFAGGKKEEVPPMPAEAALSAAPIPTPEVPAATVAAPAEAAAPADSAPAKVVKKPTGGARPAGKAATPTTPAVAPPATPLPPPKPKSPCGCAPSDLQCQIRCSATGH